MSADPARMEAMEQVTKLVEEWSQSLAQAVESMADQKPAVHGEPAGAPGPDLALLWWEQPFDLGADVKVWVGAPPATWEHIGNATLKAAGIETISPEESRSTWLEILGQALGGMASLLESRVGREVRCEAGVERAPDGGVESWSSVSIGFTGEPLEPLRVGFSKQLVALIAAAEPQEASAPGAAQHEDALPPEHADGDGRIPRHSRTMELLMDVDLPVSISFGRTQLPLKDVLKLTTGSIVELNRGVNDPVEVLVNQCLVARGEVVVVEGNYGIRIQEIASRQVRLRSLQ